MEGGGGGKVKVVGGAEGVDVRAEEMVEKGAGAHLVECLRSSLTANRYKCLGGFKKIFNFEGCRLNFGDSSAI